MLLTFPSRYLFTIGHLECLALGSGLPRFTQNSSSSALLGYTLKIAHVSATGLSPSMVHCSKEIRLQSLLRYRVPHDPARVTTDGLGCSRFARHYSGNRIRFLLLRLLRCFSSAACLYPHYIFMRESYDITHRGLPHSEISGLVCERLTEAYRCLLRPSSAPSAKASTVRPF